MLQLKWRVVLWGRYLGDISHLTSPANFFILLKSKAHDNHVIRILGTLEFLLLYCHEKIVRSNGLMGTGVEMPFHEAIVFNLKCACADRFLEQRSACVLFIGKQFVNCSLMKK